ncbi:hypothetical protein TIFTF001_013278 [Ficus carica]|uniref:Uncharacterized protein n=1 Tax=Ficus carica TaxID=3494 RepID=A0AA88D4G5_FICCA|nr:hypothetical protein TIFTF001_013278 [Ficus carica]
MGASLSDQHITSRSLLDHQQTRPSEPREFASLTHSRSTTHQGSPLAESVLATCCRRTRSASAL